MCSQLKKYKRLIIVSIIVFVIIIGVIYLLNLPPKNKEEKINVNDVTVVKDSKDPNIRDLYHQLNPEEGILFDLMGTDINKKYYAYYYRENELDFASFDDTLKTYLTINSVDYKTYPKNNNCYKIKNDDLNIIYHKIFKTDKDLSLNTISNGNPRIDKGDNDICIYDRDNVTYSKTVDTYFVNAVYQGNKLIIYERVAFINIIGDNIEFYSDVDMKNKIYTLVRQNTDLDFINNSNVVSNVLLKYQQNFNIYTYTLIKDGEYYKFDSISL